MPSPTTVYCTEADVDMLLSTSGTLSRADDDDTGHRTATESGYVTKAIAWATGRCNLYLTAYPFNQLANSYLVNQYCAIIAAYILSCRRGDPVAGSLADLYEEVMEDLKGIKAGNLQLPDVGLRSGAWPAWSNVTVTVLDTIRRVRVQRPISEKRGGPPDYQQTIDRHSDWVAPYEEF